MQAIKRREAHIFQFMLKVSKYHAWKINQIVENIFANIYR